ncbi:hypothetical protein [Parvularcula lutaonensis]|uniref:Uncharacterized protein n=1 Tax=Parvularcula lutaonensis TaxID=491923 RepID=A0ABV7MB37_9PROT|nr:hypothetical protein [Parvularcula lutaonensis]
MAQTLGDSAAPWRSSFSTGQNSTDQGNSSGKNTENNGKSGKIFHEGHGSPLFCSPPVRIFPATRQRLFSEVVGVSRHETTGEAPRTQCSQCVPHREKILASYPQRRIATPEIIVSVHGSP